MSLLPMKNDPTMPPQLQTASRKQRMAELLRQQAMQQDQGQMVSGHYVAPSITQGLAKLLSAYGSNRLEGEATKESTDYQKTKNDAIAALLKGNAPQQVAEQTQKMPAFTPEQQDRFGSPMQGVQRQPEMVNTSRAETPDEMQNRQRMKLYEAVSQYGNDPALQFALGDLNYQRERGARKEDIADERGYEETVYNRGRADKLSDVDAQRKYEDIVRKDQQGFQVSQQDRQFAQQFQMQKQSQGFQAGQNALSRAQSERMAGLNDAPVSVLGQDGKPVYVTRQQALGQQPYSAKQEAQDVAKVQQNQQAALSAQQVLDQAALLYGHKGRESGTGLSSFMSKIPATSAKDFQANLDTFKAQTFVPMVSALKGMGALSDAEGRKLSESVGALDPSMSEKAFADSLKTITKTLYEKAKVNGLNVSLPDFAMDKGVGKIKTNNTTGSVMKFDAQGNQI